MDTMNISLARASAADAAGIAAVRRAAARELAERFGHGTWSFAVDSETAVRAELQSSTLLMARNESLVLATLRLATKSPWLGDISFFTPCERPVFLTSMAVTPDAQRQGVGRQLIEEAKRVAGPFLGARAIRLDSYDAPAGAGEFYRKCGFREVRRAPYNGTPLIWFEYLL